MKDDLTRTRSEAYNSHYQTLWHACRFTRNDLETRFAYFLDLTEGGQLNGNEIQCAFRTIGVPDLEGKTILDYACGAGVTAIYFAMCGARVHAFDTSRAAIDIASESAIQSGVEGMVQFAVGDGQNLPYSDDTFDAAFCQSALHIIVEYADCPRELARVLKPGGRVAFCEEPLSYNPALALIRYFRRKKYRKCGGRTLSYKDIRRFGEPFSSVNIHHFNLLVQIKTFLGSRAYDRRCRAMLRQLERIDRLLLSAAPWLSPMCGKIVVEYTK